MAWVELIPFAAIILLVAWIFLRPYRVDNDDKQKDRDRDDRNGP